MNAKFIPIAILVSLVFGVGAFLWVRSSQPEFRGYSEGYPEEAYPIGVQEENN